MKESLKKYLSTISNDILKLENIYHAQLKELQRKSKLPSYLICTFWSNIFLFFLNAIIIFMITDAVSILLGLPLKDEIACFFGTHLSFCITPVIIYWKFIIAKNRYKKRIEILLSLNP